MVCEVTDASASSVKQVMVYLFGSQERFGGKILYSLVPLRPTVYVFRVRYVPSDEISQSTDILTAEI